MSVSTIEWIVGGSIASVHAILVLAMLALWITRRMTGTWQRLNGFMHDWDFAQKGAVLHSLGALGIWMYVGLAISRSVPLEAIGELAFLPMFVGIAMAFLGFMGFVMTFVDTYSKAPAKKVLGRCAKSTFIGMTSMVALALCSGGSEKAPDVLLALFVCAAVASAIGAIASFGAVIWFSLAEHREILRTGQRDRY